MIQPWPFPCSLREGDAQLPLALVAPQFPTNVVVAVDHVVAEEAIIDVDVQGIEGIEKRGSYVVEESFVVATALFAAA